MRFRTILFDWDGTLCDSGAALYRAFAKCLADFGLSFTLDEYKAVYTPAWYRMYEAFHLPKESWNLCDQRWLHHFDGEQPDLLPGARDVIDRCRAAGLQIGIVTGANRDRICCEFARLDLAFPAIVCLEDVVQRKPHPEGIERALAQLNAPAESCCYVGDAPEDIEMGKSAGVYTIGVVSEYVNRSRLEIAAPDLLLETIADLPAALGLGENDFAQRSPSRKEAQRKP